MWILGTEDIQELWENVDVGSLHKLFFNSNCVSVFFIFLVAGGGGRGGGGCLLEKYPANVFLGARRSLEKYPANEGASVGFTLGFPFFLL